MYKKVLKSYSIDNYETFVKKINAEIPIDNIISISERGNLANHIFTVWFYEYIRVED